MRDRDLNLVQIAALRRMLVEFNDHAWHYRLMRRYFSGILESRACRRGRQKGRSCCLKHVYNRLRRELTAKGSP